MADTNEQEGRMPVPVEVEIYINVDGSVTFADLEEKTVPIARSLDPEQPSISSHAGPLTGSPAVDVDVESG